MVIGCHIRLSAITTDGLVDKSILFISGFFDDGVAIFFLIMGFFLFKNENVGKLLKKVFFSIIIPALVVRIISEVFWGYITNQRTILDCITNIQFNWSVFVENLLSFQLTGSDGSGHLWYIHDYLKIVIMFPVLKLLCTEGKTTVAKARIWVIAICAIDIILNDIQQIWTLPWGTINPFSIFDVPVFLCLVGYMIWSNKEHIQGNKVVRSVCLVACLVVNIIRYVLQLKLYSSNINNNYFFYWNTSIGCLFAVCFACFFLTFLDKRVSILNWIGSKTFFIYLIHVMVYMYMNSIGVRNKIYEMTAQWNDLWGELAYDVIYTLLIFIACLAIATVIDLLSNMVKKIWEKFEKRL